jgi:hypothetical protein
MGVGTSTFVIRWINFLTMVCFVLFISVLVCLDFSWFFHFWSWFLLYILKRPFFLCTPFLGLLFWCCQSRHRWVCFCCWVLMSDLFWGFFLIFCSVYWVCFIWNILTLSVINSKFGFLLFNLLLHCPCSWFCKLFWMVFALSCSGA